jgi:hypothetical protein
MQVIGYTLSVPDNGTFMFRDAAGIELCTSCGYPLDFLSFNPDYQLRKREVDYRHDGYYVAGADISSTYDHRVIVSKRFRDFCLNAEYKGLAFNEFLNDKQHFHFAVKKLVKFDALRRGTLFERLCKACNNYESVVGATPSYLLRSSRLSDNFYRTDLLFGSQDRKSPDIIVGGETKLKLESAGLKGLTFLPAYGIQK